MKLKFTLIALCLITVSHVIQSQVLPRNMTDDEKEVYKKYLNGIIAKGYTTPPGVNVRTAAEWEEMHGIIISWQGYTDVLTKIVKHAVKEGEVYIVTQTPDNVESKLSEENISLSNITFLEVPSNSVWIRDYGPNNIYLDTIGELAFVDWIYNRPRPAGDAIPSPLSMLYSTCCFEAAKR